MCVHLFVVMEFKLDLKHVMMGCLMVEDVKMIVQVHY